MPAINFKHRYAAAILAGTKRQTIRQPRADNRPHAKPGDRLMLYTGMRTKSCRKLMDAICEDRQQIVITDDFRIIVNGLPVDDEDAFAVADGFENCADFFDFFAEIYGLPFEGSLIKWRPAPSDSQYISAIEKDPRRSGGQGVDQWIRVGLFSEQAGE